MSSVKVHRGILLLIAKHISIILVSFSHYNKLLENIEKKCVLREAPTKDIAGGPRFTRIFGKIKNRVNLNLRELKAETLEL